MISTAKHPIDPEEKKCYIAQVIGVRNTIAEMNDKKGTVPCPRCGGEISFVKASYNGHIQASCEAGCIRFME